MNFFKRPINSFVLTLLLIEFLDEFVFGVQEAAWPFIRDDLGLTYAQIGILLSAPKIFSSLIEPALGLLADTVLPSGRSLRRWIVLSGGVLFAAACAVIGASGNFAFLLLGILLFYPSSGAFVSVSQAALMDHDPARRELNMARWTFAGSAGVVVGALALGASVSQGSGWRPLFFALGGLALGLTFLARRYPFRPLELPGAPPAPSLRAAFTDGVTGLLGLVRRAAVWRWLILLEFSDLLLDVLYSYLALYFVDVVAATPAQAGLAVAVWAGVGLVGDFLLIPLVERFPGLAYLRVSVLIELALYPLFLLAPGFELKLLILGLLGFFNAGWYAILRAGLYAEMPGRSGASLAVDNLAGVLGSLLPFAVGLAAERYNLGVAMWLLLAGPLALLVGLPPQSAAQVRRDDEA